MDVLRKRVDISLTADHPLAAAFNDGNEVVYVAHNYDPAPIVVTFSDGYMLPVPAKSMATSKDIALSGIISSSFPEAYPGGSVDLGFDRKWRNCHQSRIHGWR